MGGRERRSNEMDRDQIKTMGRGKATEMNRNKKKSINHQYEMTLNEAKADQSNKAATLQLV